MHSHPVRTQQRKGAPAERRCCCGGLREGRPYGWRIELVRLSQRPKTWYFRFYVRGSGQQKKGYVVRSLKTDDRGQAERRAYEEWRKLKTIEEDGGSITAKSIQDLMDDWLDKVIPASSDW